MWQAALKFQGNDLLSRKFNGVNLLMRLLHIYNHLLHFISWVRCEYVSSHAESNDCSTVDPVAKRMRKLHC